MSVTFKNGRQFLSATALLGFVSDVSAKLAMTPDQLAVAVGVDPSLLNVHGEVNGEIFWPFARVAYEHRLIDRLPANGLPAVNYDLVTDVDLERTPLGLDADLTGLDLEIRPTKIAGFTVDFPLGVPASILTANASFLKYYANRGYSILTYKTVRSTFHSGHAFPQWICLKNPAQFEVADDGKLVSQLDFAGELLRFPSDPTRAAMANSFGVPSADPSWWQDDLRQARGFIREGHEVLIVSVMSSVSTGLEAITADFAKTAGDAKACGADIIELNFSCPNTPERAGMIYHSPDDARVIAEAVREAVGPSTPIFTKIGYLNDAELRHYVERTASAIDGIVAINTMLGSVANAAYDTSVPAFPGQARAKAGVSGWAIQEAAHRLASKLISLRKEISDRTGKKLTILGLGGVMTKADFEKRLALGVDAVEICTGTYFNPMLGFECRNAQGKVELFPPDDIIGKGPSSKGLSGATSLSSSGASSRAHERSADVPKAHEKKPKSPSYIDPLAAIVALNRHYDETPREKDIEDRKKWMAGVVEEFGLNND